MTAAIALPPWAVLGAVPHPQGALIEGSFGSSCYLLGCCRALRASDPGCWVPLGFPRAVAAMAAAAAGRTSTPAAGDELWADFLSQRDGYRGVADGRWICFDDVARVACLRPRLRSDNEILESIAWGLGMDRARARSMMQDYWAVTGAARDLLVALRRNRGFLPDGALAAALSACWARCAVGAVLDLSALGPAADAAEEAGHESARWLRSAIEGMNDPVDVIF